MFSTNTTVVGDQKYVMPIRSEKPSTNSGNIVPLPTSPVAGLCALKKGCNCQSIGGSGLLWCSFCFG